jgi:hypothetical protein
MRALMNEARRERSHRSRDPARNGSYVPGQVAGLFAQKENSDFRFAFAPFFIGATSLSHLGGEG